MLLPLGVLLFDPASGTRTYRNEHAAGGGRQTHESGRMHGGRLKLHTLGSVRRTELVLPRAP